MSVTFWMPQAPLMRIQPYPEDEPDYWEEVPADPFVEINMANSNAADLLRLIDPCADYTGGEWGPDKIERLHRRVMKLLNLDPKKFETPGYVEGRLHVFGRDTNYVQRRLTDMLTLLAVARQHGFYICYG